MKCKTRKKWKNHAGNQTVTPLRLCWPSTLADVVEAVKDAERLNLNVRGVGSGHSWSDAAISPDLMLLPGDLSRILTLNKTVLKPAPNLHLLVEVESGVTIRELNEHLDDHGLALPNMGGYDGQTVIGATATSTHGSGLRFGPLTEMIRSLDIVASGGRVIRVEPAGGITDPVKYRQQFGNDRELIQRDPDFFAAGVGLGSVGIVYSAIIEVVPSFFLKEVRTLTTWEDEKVRLIKGDVFEIEHYELLLNPYKVGAGHSCLVTTRVTVPPPGHLPPDKTNRNFITELFSSLKITGVALRLLFNTFPDRTPKLLEQSLQGLVDDGYTNKSYKVFNIGAANDLPALSAEHGFAMQSNHYIAAIDKFLEIAHEAAERGRAFQTGPIAVRFVKGSGFLMSPQHGRNTAMTEMIAVSGTTTAPEMLHRYEEAAYAMDGRPHLGQLNHLAGLDLVAKLFPAVGNWRDIRRTVFDPNRTFDGPVTRRLGL
jgi:L-gulono-1,4-lactone dehydrogenase